MCEHWRAVLPEGIANERTWSEPTECQAGRVQAGRRCVPGHRTTQRGVRRHAPLWHAARSSRGAFLTLFAFMSKVRKLPSYVRTRGIRAAAGRVLYALTSGEAFRGQFVAYETPAEPLTEIDHTLLHPAVSVRYHCDFAWWSGLSLWVKASRATRLVLTLTDASGTVVRRSSTGTGPLSEDGLTYFRFRALAESADKDFTISVAATTPNEASIAVNRSRTVGSLSSNENGVPQSLFYSSDRVATQYDLWIRRHEPSDEMLTALRAQDATQGPLISVVVPAYRTPLNVLDAMMASLIDQTWPRWELCVANAGSPDEDVGQALDRWAASDSRIHVVHLGENRGIAGNTNAALELATGTYVAFLDHDDTLAPFALSCVVQAITDHGQADMLYSDEDKLDGTSGRRLDPFFKPDWSPHLLICVNYIAHLLCIRKELVGAVSGLRRGFDGSQDYDLILRCSERAREIVHIPKVLYHWRTSPSSTASDGKAKLYAYEAGRRALQEHLTRTGLDGEVTCRSVLGHYQVRLHVPEHLAVSVLIPSHDNPRLLARAVKSCLEASPAVREVLVLENGSKLPETLSAYRQIGQIDRVRVLDYGETPFNYSLINNWGAEQAQGDALLFLNDDVYAHVPGWLEAMAQWLAESNVGAVGARLSYPNGLIQHNGVVLGMGGIAGHRDKDATDQEAAARDIIADDVRDGSAVTAACLLVRRIAFEDVGGFDEAFPLAFGDVDLCLRLQKRGYRIVCTPNARLVHQESATRGGDFSANRLSAFLEASRLMRSRWGPELDSDPFYSPNLTLNESLPRMRMT